MPCGTSDMQTLGYRMVLHPPTCGASGGLAVSMQLRFSTLAAFLQPCMRVLCGVGVRALKARLLACSKEVDSGSPAMQR
jgi:hypothetical protein